MVSWKREMESNHRHPGYEPGVLPLNYLAKRARLTAYASAFKVLPLPATRTLPIELPRLRVGPTRTDNPSAEAILPC